MKNKYFFLKCSIPFALSYWLFDSVIHYFIYNEFEFEIIPSDINELSMRCIIFILLIVFGLFSDYYMNKLIEKDVEKFEVYGAMLSATNHILNNFLNNMLFFRDAAIESKDFNKDLLKLYDKVIEDTIKQINNLDNLQAPTKGNIEERYKL